jgi:hypothetical protein
MKHQNEVDNDKQNRKKLKRFGMSIINQSTAVGWEDAEIARLILLVTSELGIRGKKIIKFLYKTSAFSSHIIACLLDEGLSIKPIKVLRYMSRITDCEGFLGILAEGFDCDLYDIENEELLAYVSIICIIYFMYCNMCVLPFLAQRIFSKQFYNGAEN